MKALRLHGLADEIFRLDNNQCRRLDLMEPWSKRDGEEPRLAASAMSMGEFEDYRN